MNTGWGFEQVLDEMNDDRFRALREQWRRQPPAHWLIAAFVGYKPPAAPEKPADFEAAYAAVARDFVNPERFFAPRGTPVR